MMDEQKTIPLRRSVTVGSTTTYDIELREPTAAQYLEFDRALRKPGFSPYEASLLLISAVSGLDMATVKAIGVRDIRNADEYLSGFFSASPTTGSESSGH